MAAEAAPRTPPRNEEAERALLGALLLDDERVAEVADFLRPDDFYDRRHARVFDSVGVFVDPELDDLASFVNHASNSALRRLDVLDQERLAGCRIALAMIAARERSVAVKSDHFIREDAAPARHDNANGEDGNLDE